MTIRRFVRMAHCMRVLPGTPGRAGKIHSGTISHGLPVRKKFPCTQGTEFLILPDAVPHAEYFLRH